LSSTGAGFINHTNCTIDKGTKAWYIEGKADVESQTITFETCNSGGFTAYGTFISNTFGFSGTVDCISKQTGEKWITIVATQ